MHAVVQRITEADLSSARQKYIFFFVPDQESRFATEHVEFSVQTHPNMAKFQPRERKQKAIRRTEESNGIRKSKGGGTAADPNAACIIPESQVQREERKKSLREELRAQAAEKGTKVSSKKAKRLDKYIVCSDIRCTGYPDVETTVGDLSLFFSFLFLFARIANVDYRTTNCGRMRISRFSKNYRMQELIQVASEVQSILARACYRPANSVRRKQQQNKKILCYECIKLCICYATLVPIGSSERRFEDERYLYLTATVKGHCRH